MPARPPSRAFTRDGSYLRLNTQTREIEFPDGSIHTFDSLTDGRPTQIRDRSGNTLSIEYIENVTVPDRCEVGESAWHLSDAHQRHHWVCFQPTGLAWQPKVVRKVDLAAFGGSRAVYDFEYNDGLPTPPTAEDCRDNDPASPMREMWLLTSIRLPDDSTFRAPLVDYRLDHPTECHRALLSGLGLPTLGRLEWEYMTYQFPARVGPGGRGLPWSNKRGVAARRLRDSQGNLIGLWTYSTELGPEDYPGGPIRWLRNDTTDPLGNQTKNYFSVCVHSACETQWSLYGLPFDPTQPGGGPGQFLSKEVRQGSSAVLRRSYVSYDHDAIDGYPGLTPRTRLNQRLVSQRTIYEDDAVGASKRFADESYAEFDGLGHYRERRVNGNFAGQNLRVTRTEFNPDRGVYGVDFTPIPADEPWILNTFTWDRVASQEGSAGIYRSYCFDSTTGLLLRQRLHLSDLGDPASTDVMTVFEYTAGNLTRESWYGGDFAPLGPKQEESGEREPKGEGPVALCGALVPSQFDFRMNHTYQHGVRRTSEYANTTFLVLDLDIDSSTGLPSASRDTAGLATTFVYDAHGRLIRSQPAGEAVTEYSYFRADEIQGTPGPEVQIEQRTAPSPSGSSLKLSWIRFDNFGRSTTTWNEMPESNCPGSCALTMQKTTLNALGWKMVVETPHLESQLPAGSTSYQYDRFGRPTVITPPDGVQHDVTFAYTGVAQVSRTSKVRTQPEPASETDATTVETYDRFGRLVEIVEPNNVKTRYEYDAADRLRKVCQNVDGMGQCGQVREFSYDNRGFLLSEKHPEKGATGNGTVIYSLHNSKGQPARKQDGAWDLSFLYDWAERLEVVHDTGAGFQACEAPGSPRCWKQFDYASTNSGSNLRKGKLETARRWNYLAPHSMDLYEIAETYTYAGAHGRVSARGTTVEKNGAAKEAFSQSFTWNLLGELEQVGYPNCTNPSVCGSSFPRSQGFGYARGWRTSVPNYATQLQYHPNALLKQVNHANGVTFTQAVDAHGMARPERFEAKRGGVTAWQLGPYSFDGTGNVVRLPPWIYSYDSLGRMLQEVASCECIEEPCTPCTPITMVGMSYDPYGNVTGVERFGQGFLETPTSPATNRLTGAVQYGSDGTLTSWNGNAYAFDPFGALIRYQSGAEEWMYLYTADGERVRSLRTGRPDHFYLRDLDGRLLRDYTVLEFQGDAWRSDFTFVDWIYRGDQPLATVDRAGTVRHLHLDHLGSVRYSTDAMGDSVATHDYDAYGLERSYSGAPGDRRWALHERDRLNTPENQADDLVYMHARHYNPTLGRFLAPDYLNGDPKSPRSWNRYAYVLGNPMRMVDPDGREPIDSTLARFLSDFYGRDLSQTKVYGGIFSRLVTSMRGAFAVSLGRSIFFSRSGWEEYKAKSEWGVVLTAHEARHIVDTREKGFWRFLLAYMANSKKWEARADEDEELVKRLLRSTDGLLRSIQDGTYAFGSVRYYGMTPSEKWQQPVSPGLIGGLGFLSEFEGELWIDGINLTNVFSQITSRR